MRSEERAGIVFAVLLFLWGTVVCDPFRIFARYLIRVSDRAFRFVGMPDIVSCILMTVLICLLTLILLKISGTRFVIFIPCAIAAACLGGFTVWGFVKGEVYVPEACALAVPVIILIALYLLKLDKILVWVADIYIFSLPVALITYLITYPLSRAFPAAEKFLYINRNCDVDLTYPFEGLAGIPGFVFGIFLFVIVSLPVIYLAMGKRKGVSEGR
ncbi:MAG: hypothetical protein J5715_09790 [Clostridiales bacterium]|nr:hypothetical protein [Clostridiales bacterium]MBO4580431.1 hypothetical protein [Clostridiales bacterium]